MDYWKECISEALDEAKVEATADQITSIASAVEGAHDNHGLYTGDDVADANYNSSKDDEVKNLKDQLEKEQGKRGCPICNGRGYSVISVGSHSSEHTCPNCNGDGKL
jgi:DnaJ-class molecular chaperone